MYVRRSAAALAATVAIGTAVATPAVAADSSPSPSPSVAIPAGLYGDADPTYDGVWRQSLALIAQKRMKLEPAAKAIDWLTGQQCANGSFAAFRAAPSKACDAKVMVDTNSTAVAVQGLAAVGEHDAEVEKAVTWLKSVQNKDGGWGYTPGGASDANSTSVVIGALNAVGTDPAEVRRDGKSSYDALLKLALPCAKGGAFAYQPDKKGTLSANADATAAAVVAASGQGMLTAKAGDKAEEAACADGARLTPEQAAANGAAYLGKALDKDGHLKSALAGAEDQPDYGNTADAVVALAVQGGEPAARKPLRWLEKNAASWAKQSGPAAYAQLILAADAAGADPRDFGGTDLVEQLNATGPAPQKAADKQEAKEDDDNPFGAWWYIGVFLVVGIGIGFLLSGRNKGGRQ
ncbi:prenyltransferase/squalene oxidase repeat-containing protein [Streptomyces sp. NPDC049627]|uniref:prenyltransferase/squalene oxidase repeat-containing protein n=1 Tax=Streptomyces sp. NPDC049627 TaxID=3365595 RepID=UPI0037B203F1